jgi:hypothetical protein
LAWTAPTAKLLLVGKLCARTILRQEMSFLATGNLWYGAALLNDDGTMKGSMYVVNFESEKAMQKWLDKEPYAKGRVWKEITIHKSNTRDPWQFNRPEGWFKEQR